jgi:hypothetical protein
VRLALALVVAALVAWLVWSRLGGDGPAAPATPAASTADGGPTRPGTAVEAPPRGARSAAGTGAAGAALVPLGAMVRATLAADFAHTKLSAADREALARGDVPGVAARLYARTDGDATAALARLWSICVIRPGRVDLERRELSQWMPERVSADLASRVDASIEQQRGWSAQFAAGCEAAGFFRGGPGRARIMERLRTCADSGHAECLATLAVWDDADPARSLSRLQSAALLGSVEAQKALLAQLEYAPNANTEAMQAAIRFWRQALAKADPEYRATFGSCTDAACDPAARDPHTVRTDLEAAAREGSLYALATLGGVDSGSEGVSSADTDFAPAGATVKPPYLNPSEVDAYAWRALLEKLALQGCLGFWPNWATYVGARDAAARQLRPAQLAEANALAERYYADYGAKVAATRGCSAQ